MEFRITFPDSRAKCSSAELKLVNATDTFQI